MSISHDYGVLIDDEGIALCGLFIIDPKGILSTKKASGSSKFVWPPVPADRAKLR
ncbi:uncharacterized protein BXZ73DRAFT_96862 [Epithele typhae]|uniref:uncharacterized protein n=1 Tax=Epithele typhae TaxID=378194 RepID=UPI002007479A|nr:uncharacterized protein BXZ73DRAFT_96862 [Epithele typhae]KAH9944373.1 hypothetical protein BXZ73DRAFT_96862 [Epithele typhae]